MDELLRLQLEDIRAIIGHPIERMTTLLATLNPKQEWVMWVQLIAGAMTVTWIIIQFAAWRRLNEARVDRYLEERIDSEREDLARERQETLLQIDRVVARRGIIRAILLAWAHFVLTVSFFLRILNLETIKGLSNHTELLLQVGHARRARRVYLDIAKERENKIKLYEGALANARLEAQNALIFAGRIAVLERRPAAAVAAFKRVLRLQNDPDARLLVAEQMIASDPDGALQQLNEAIVMPEVLGKPQTRSELHRCIAKVAMIQGAFRRARNALNDARQIDEPLRYYSGIGKTEELRGDLYAPRSYFQNAAQSAYETSIRNFRLVPDLKRVAAVEQKLRRLRGSETVAIDGWWTRLLERRAKALFKQVEVRRARASMKVQ